jgi:L-rhamnose mutarotase
MQPFGPKCSPLCVKRMSSVCPLYQDPWHSRQSRVLTRTDYSIHYLAPLNLLIAHMRYIGPPENYDKDMAGIAESEDTKRWWKVSLGPVLCKPSG